MTNQNKNKNKKFIRLKNSIKKEIENARMPLAYQYMLQVQAIRIYHGISESKFHCSNSYGVGFFNKPISLINFNDD